MKKKILLVYGSPRAQGNSDLLCDSFAKGAQKQGYDIEKLYLRQKQIGYCVACDYCKQHHGKCIQKDDMSEILDKMIKSDIIVLASPVYFYSIDAQIKTMIDRCVAMYEEITNKTFYFVVTAADNSISSVQRSLECFRGFIDCLPGAQEKGVIYGVGAWHKGDILNSDAMQTAYHMGLEA